MIRGLRNRKGDVTITTVILIVLGLAVLVMMILGFTKGWDVIFKPFSNAPSELQTLAKACGVYAQGSLSIDFCQYRLIGKELVNCKDQRILKSLDADGINYGSISQRCEEDGGRKACGNIDLVPESKRSSIQIGDKTCADIVSSASGKSKSCVGTRIKLVSRPCSDFKTEPECDLNNPECEWK